MTAEERLHRVLFKAPQHLGTLHQVFEWVEGFTDDEPIDPLPANWDHNSEWVWVSRDELHFYTVESLLFPSGNSKARPLNQGDTYTNWLLFGKMHHLMDRLDKLLAQEEERERDKRQRRTLKKAIKTMIKTKAAARYRSGSLRRHL